MAEKTFAIQKIGKWSLVGLRVAGLSLAVYLIFSLSAHSFAVFWDIPSVILVVGPIFPICVLLKWKHHAHIAPLLYALGTPLGLLGVSLGLITMFSNMIDLRALAPATAVLLLTALYGGIISGLGYLFLEPKQTAMPNIPKRAAFFCSLPIAVFTLLAMQDNLWALFGESGEVLAMGALVLILSLITPTSHSLLKRITSATMYVVLILTILGVIDLAGIGAETAYADPEAYLKGMSKIYLSINTGLLIYIFCIVWSIATGDFDDTDFGRMNWHLVEAFSLIVLITISPPSLYHFIS